MEAPQIHEHSWGSVDLGIPDIRGNELYLWDFKFGFEAVEVFENWQLMNYAAGKLREMGVDGHIDQFTKVHLCVVQPRAHHPDGPIRRWIVTASYLRPYFNILRTNAEKALGPNAEFHTGNHCKHCPGRHACPAALKAGVSLYEVAAAPLPVGLTPEALGVQLSIVKRALTQLECLESGLEEQVKGLLRSGATVEGWSVQEGVGREKWDKPISEVIALGEILNTSLLKPADVITPKQARKLGVDDAVITAYSTTPRTGLQVVPDNGNKAKQVFSK